MNVGVIGCGYWGPQLVRNFDELSDSNLVAVADKREDRRRYIEHRYPRTLALEDHRELLNHDVEAVVVATPMHTHFNVAKEALLAGKHVLVEKPLAATVEEALELTAIARERGLTLMVGHTFLYNPAVQELRRLVQDGDLGRVYYADGARLNLGLLQSHLNVIWDLAPHDVSILLYIFGEMPSEVRAYGRCFIQPKIHDVAYIDVQFPSGVFAQIHLSWLDPNKVRRLTLVGDKKMAVYNDVSLGEKIRVYDKGVDLPSTDNFGEFQMMSYRQGQVVIPHIAWQEPLALQCQHFIACARTGLPPRTDGIHGANVVAVLEAADYSLHHDGMSVPVRELKTDDVQSFVPRSEPREALAASLAV